MNSTTQIQMTYEEARKIVSVEKQKELDKISNRQLATDINNTLKEIGAYKQLVQGYKTLAEIPETGSVKATEYRYRAMMYDGLENTCREFLKRLVALKEVREHERKDQPRKPEGSALPGA